jgi:hypothetical protein
MEADLDEANRARNQCVLRGPYTTQGHELCKALMRVNTRRAEITGKLEKIADQPFDLSLIGLAFLSAGALAADSHESTLAGLGILSATTIGLRQYASSRSRRSAYLAGFGGLGCLSEASSHLLWDDSWFYRLRSYRRLLGETMGVLAQAAEESTDQDLRQRAAALQQSSMTSMQLADQAVAQYAALGTRIDGKREEILAAMHGLIDDSRGDVGAIVTSILNAQSVKQAKNEQVDDAQEEVEDTATENAASGPAATMAVSAVVSAIGVEPSRVVPIPDIGTKLADVAAMAAREMPDVQGEGVSGKQARAKLTAAIATVIQSMREIAYIAPRYIKATNEVDACVIG